MEQLKRMDLSVAIDHAINMKNIAIVGIKQDGAAWKDMQGLISRGYCVYPVNPELATKGISIQGIPVVSSLVEIDETVECVNLHIKSEDVEFWVNDISERMERRADIDAVWFEPGIELGTPVIDAADFGWMVVSEKCLLREVKNHNLDFLMEEVINKL